MMPYVSKKEEAVDKEIGVLTENWIGVNYKTDKFAHDAWVRFRREQLGAGFIPKNFTVPSLLPPENEQAVREYLAVVRQIRRLIGWNTTDSAILEFKRPEGR